jgi:membrane-bound serine protease (ClpP class)
MDMKSGVSRILGIVLGVLLMVPSLRAADAPSTAPSANNHAVIIRLAGEIDDYNRDALFQRFDQARKLGANVIILNVDTYGGLVTSGLEISRYIKRQSDLHVIAFVEDKAISAGAMIAMACDEIVMSGSSSLGDCAPIIFGPQGLETMGPAERAKAEGPVLLDFEESAGRNHRDPLLAAAMVDVKRSVYWVQNDAGERRFVDEKEYQDLTKTGKWVSVPGEASPIDGPNSLLTVDGEQAVRYGLASGKAGSAQALAQQRGYQIIADLTPSAGERLVEVLNGAFMRGLLISIFLACLYVVLNAPGHGAAEVIGLTALGLMLGVPMLTGYAQWWEILLIFCGLGLIAFEILLPGHIFPGVTGAVLLFVGLVMTFVPTEPGGLPNILPNAHATWLAARTGIVVVAASMSVSMFLWFWMNRYLPKMPYFNRLILTATSGNTTQTGLRPVAGGASAPSTAPNGINSWPPIGAIGRAVSDLRPGGSVEFFDPATSDTRITSVISESGLLNLGAEVVVRQVSGPTIIVRKRA